MALEGASVLCATSKTECMSPSLLLSTWGLNNERGNDGLLYCCDPDMAATG